MSLHWGLVGLCLSISLLVCASSKLETFLSLTAPAGRDRFSSCTGFQQSLDPWTKETEKCFIFLIFVREGCSEPLSCGGGQLLSQWQITFGKTRPAWAACGVPWQKDNYCEGSSFWQGSWKRIGRLLPPKGLQYDIHTHSFKKQNVGFPKSSRWYMRTMCARCNLRVVLKDKGSTCFLRQMYITCL